MAPTFYLGPRLIGTLLGWRASRQVVRQFLPVDCRAQAIDRRANTPRIFLVAVLLDLHPSSRSHAADWRVSRDEGRHTANVHGRKWHTVGDVRRLLGSPNNNQPRLVADRVGRRRKNKPQLEDAGASLVWVQCEVPRCCEPRTSYCLSVTSKIKGQKYLGGRTRRSLRGREQPPGNLYFAEAIGEGLTGGSWVARRA